MSQRFFRTSLMLSAVVLVGLAGCGGPQDELREWMEQERRQAKPNVSPLSPPKKFDPQPYQAATGVEPFSNQKLSVAIKQENRQANSLMAAELNRRKQPLEAYPVDSLLMVGSVTKLGRPYALLRANNLLYQVGVGEYIGQNYGLIKKITETEITFREVLLDASGEMTEHMSTLQLQEKAR